ncbi:unnamed protein product [Candidula unifasciata]|uniref:G-protein coupled receptors family 1 profile domain-containing protein n=1 Tax=Candidula unifasciata TaxID=100452 RepID=A0A8S4A520_9EUPU|nr:unnamed protein product [Candidula unifasciata]
MEPIVTLSAFSEIDNYESSINDVAMYFTDEITNIFLMINFACLCGLISFLGIIANIINLIIFYRQGLNTTINIGFFSLALSDLCSLVLQQVFNVFVNLRLSNSDVPVVFVEIQFLTATLSREMFTTITSLITVYITAERCLCIVFPLQVKQMISLRSTIVVMIVIFAVTLLSPIAIYSTSYLEWKFYPNINRSFLSMGYKDNFETCEVVSYFIHAIVGLVSYLAVVIFTLILIYKLQEKHTFYRKANLNQDKTRSLSKRDRTTMATVVLIATILIVCFIPAGILCIMSFLEPEFNVRDKYHNMFYCLWSFAMLFESINSSVPIVLYLRMSTRFRTQFRLLFYRCLCPIESSVIKNKTW